MQQPLRRKREAVPSIHRDLHSRNGVLRPGLQFLEHPSQITAIYLNVVVQKKQDIALGFSHSQVACPRRTFAFPIHHSAFTLPIAESQMLRAGQRTVVNYDDLEGTIENLLAQ